MYDEIERGNIDAVRDAIALGSIDADIMLCDAVIHGQKDIAELSITVGADVNQIDYNEEFYPLHHAVKSENLQIVKLLIEHGVKVNCFDYNEETPLDHCFIFCKKRYEIADYLMGKGGIMNHRKVQRYIDGCVRWNSPHHLQFLINNGAKVTGDINYLCVAAEKGYVEVVKILIENGHDVHDKDEKGWLPLHIAAKNGHLEVIKLLLEKRAEIESKNTNNWKPIHYACYYGHLEVAKYLHERGSTLSDSLISMAAKNGHFEVVEWLVSLKEHTFVDYHWCNKTALYYAAENGYFEVVKLLLQKNATKDIRCNGKTAAEIALKMGHKNIAAMLQ